MTNEIVKRDDGAIAVTEDAKVMALLANDTPELIMARAIKASKVLGTVIAGKKKPVVFNGEQYIEFEDWQTVGNFYNIAAKVVTTKFVEFGSVQGFECHAEAINTKTGAVVSAADAMCLNDEEKWSTRAKYEWKSGVKVKMGEVAVPLFQLRSMAQTRACAKALRNVLAWIVVLAGYKPSVAEEMVEGGDHSSEQEAQGHNPAPQRKSQAQAAPAQAEEGKTVVYTGRVDKHYEPKGRSKYWSFTLDTEPRKYLQTADEFLIETMMGHENSKAQVKVTVNESQDGQYLNRRITGVEPVSTEQAPQ